MLDVPPALDDLADDDRARVKAELAPGERLLWAGRPIPKPVRVTGGYLIAAFFALGCGAICVLLILSLRAPAGRFAPAENDGRTVGAFSAGFLAVITTWMTISAWRSKLAAARGEARRIYALTDRRAIFWQPVAGSEGVIVTSYRPELIENLYRIENPDGSGDVKFSGTGPSGSGFDNIADVRRVEDLVRMNLGPGVGRRKDEMEEDDL